jgi:hypothetical protein
MRARFTAIAAITVAVFLGGMTADASAQMHCSECDFSTACSEECYYYDDDYPRWTTCGEWGVCAYPGPQCSSVCGPFEPCAYGCQDELGQWMSCYAYTSGQCDGVCEPEEWTRADVTHGQWTQVQWFGPPSNPFPVCFVWLTRQVRYEDRECPTPNPPILEECYLEDWGTYPDTTDCCDNPPHGFCWGQVWPASCQG